jgi:16S rRNA (adenine(1408)-N(1))-methyltransferase
VGTGDARAVLAAAADPDTFAIGIDAEARSMAESSRRAARPARKGGRPNAIFIAAGVETLPAELSGLADLVTVSFPWGSLLRGALGLDAAVAERIGGLVASAGRLEIALSLTDRDQVTGRDAGPFTPADLACIEATFGTLGLAVVEGRALSADDSAVRHSTWAHRLDVPRTRPGCLVRLIRTG